MLPRLLDGRPEMLNRAVALLADAVPVFFGVLFLSAFVGQLRGVPGDSAVNAGLGWFWFPAWVVVRTLYHAPLEGLFGATGGKWLTGLRVRGEEGGAPGLRAAFTRNAFRAVDGILLNLVGAAVASRLDGRRLGDYMAGTRVELVGDPIAVFGEPHSPGPANPEPVQPEPVYEEPGYEEPRDTPAPEPPLALPPRTPPPQTPQPEREPEPSLSDFTTDLTERALEGLLPPVVGRESEVRQVERTLGRTKKNNPVLVGEAGVGKTAIAEGLARRAAGVEPGASPSLRGKRVLELDVTALDAGTVYRGMFEARMEAVVRQASRPNVILFVDEMHRLMSAGGHAEASGVAANILKPALARGDLKMVGATTLEEYRLVEKDPAMERRLEPITVPPLSVEDTTEVLRRWASSHLANVEPAALAVAASWSERYLRGNLPDKALALVDDAVAGKKQEGSFGAVTKEDLARVIQDKTRIEVPVGASDRDRLRTLEAELRARVVGQDAAARTVAKTVARRAVLGGGDRPASLLFLGPSGVGKTEMAKALAAAFFGGERRMVRVDMSEMQSEGAINRLIGSPRGYVGSEGGGQLTEALKREPSSVVLLDEVEKAHERVYDVLLQLLGDGRLTDGLGNTIDCKHAVVVMTSNVGAERILEGDTDPETAVSELLSRGFRPEIVGRIDEKVIFGPLSREALEEIVGLLARPTLAGVLENHGVEVELDDSLVSRIAREGYDPRFGARELAGAVRRRVEDQLTELLMDGDLAGHGRVVLWYDEEAGTVEWEDGRVEPSRAEPVPPDGPAANRRNGTVEGREPDGHLTNEDRLQRGLALLREGLAPFVEQELRAHLGETWLDVVNEKRRAENRWDMESDPQGRPVWDVQRLLGVMLDWWEPVFARATGRPKGLVFGLMRARNGWAHQDPFSDGEAARALEAARRLLEGIGAGEEARETAALAGGERRPEPQPAEGG